MVYIFVETNFLLTLALKQEEFAHAYKILRLAEEQKITLVIPSISIPEAYSAFFDKKSSQIELRKTFANFSREAIRSSHFKNSLQQYLGLETTIEKKLDKELKMLDDNIIRILKCATCISHDINIHRKGISMRTRLVLKNEIDAFVLATLDSFVTRNLPRNSKVVFLTEDSKTIASKPEVKQYMSRKKIKLLTSYKTCIEFLKSKNVQ